MNYSAEDRASDRAIWRNLTIVVGVLVGVAFAIIGWVTFLSHALEGKI